MKIREFWFTHRSVSSLMLTTLLLALMAAPAPVWHDQGGPGFQPVRCWRVLSDNQVIESDDCLRPRSQPRFPDIVTRPQVLPQIARAEEMPGSDNWSAARLGSSLSDR